MPTTPVWLPRDGNGQSDSDFLAINPAGHIPVLITPEGDALYEVAALMVYLADRHQLSNLAPAVSDPLRGPLDGGGAADVMSVTNHERTIFFTMVERRITERRAPSCNTASFGKTSPM